MDAFFAAWTAGFFDGEGCVIVSVSNGTSKKWPDQVWMSLIVSIHQLALEPLAEIEKHYGGKIVRSRGSGDWRKSKAATYKWRVHNQEAVEFLRIIRPYSILKAAEIDAALEWPHADWRGQYNPVPQWAKEKRLEIRNTLIRIRADRKDDAVQAHQKLVEAA